MLNYLIVLLGMFILCSCADYNFSKAVYEGVRTREHLQSTPAERAAQPDLNYQQYESERRH